MLHGPQRGLFDLTFATPSACAGEVETGAADIGIVPVVEARRMKLATIPGVGIACRGPVRSILLIVKVPPDRIRTLAADTSSRTSVQLALVILQRRYGVTPALLPKPADLEPMLAEADAALIIGDPALHLDPESLPYQVLDLGQEWWDLSGLPMVFAKWAGPSGAIQPWMEDAFSGSMRFGLNNINRIVAVESQSRGLPEDLVRAYLTRHICFEIGPEEEAGMRKFFEWQAALPVPASWETVAL